MSSSSPSAPQLDTVSQAQSVRPKHALDAAALDACVRRALPDCGGLADIKQFQGGQSNPTYLLRCKNGRLVVLRKPPPGKLLATAHDVAREHKLLAGLHRAGFPVPQPLYVHTPSGEGDALPFPFYLMQCMEGVIYRDIVVSALETPDERRRVFTGLVDTLARLHSVDVAAAGLADLARGGADSSSYYERQVRRWWQQYEASRGTAESMRRVSEYLKANVPASSAPVLVHGDFRIDNVVFEPGTLKVLAVLDWELAAIGDGLADLGYLCMPYHLPLVPGVPLGGLMSDELPLGVPCEDEVVLRYMRQRGIKRIDNFNYYVAFAMFRGASILQGVAARAQAGNAANDNAASVGVLSQMLADMADKLCSSPPRAFELQRSVNGAANATPSPALDQVFASLRVSERAAKLYEALRAFVDDVVVPAEAVFEHQVRVVCPSDDVRTWQHVPIVEQLKREARARGLWNLFMSDLSVLEYGLLAGLMGRSPLTSEACNCSAPDTGNMEVLEKFGTPEQKARWLEPLLDGRIRSCFAMTEPSVASSDATNISCSLRVDGDRAIVNGHKWWISGAGDPRCKISIVMCRSDSRKGEPVHKQHTMVLVPMDTPGVRVVRALPLFGYDDRPHGHCEMLFENVVVPASNIIAGEGMGFAIAQARLGPGRIHHCMRLVGMAERAVQLMVARAKSRVAFGRPLALHGGAAMKIARCRCLVEQTRVLVLQAAAKIDAVGAKKAGREIAMIKIAGPANVCEVLDEAIQLFGGAGVSNDEPLARMYAWARCLRLADGPDEVHLLNLAKMELTARL